MSKPAATTVICNGRDSVRLPFRSVAISFVTMRSPAFTLSAARSQSRCTRASRPVASGKAVSFHSPAFTFTTCTTFASPTSSLARAVSFTSSSEREIKSCFGSINSTAGPKSAAARSSYSGLNLFSKSVFAATRCTRYVPDPVSGTRAPSRPSGSTASGILTGTLPRSTCNSPLFTG